MPKAQKPYEIVIALKLRAADPQEARAKAEQLVKNFKSKGVPAELHCIYPIRESEMG